MKKITLVLLLLISALIGQSQTFFKVTKATYDVYSGGEWITKQTEYPTNVYVITKNDEVKISNNAQSKFKLYSGPTKEYSKENIYISYYTWKAIDDKGNDCIFIMTYKEDKFIIATFAYPENNYAFMFFIDPNNQ